MDSSFKRCRLKEKFRLFFRKYDILLKPITHSKIFFKSIFNEAELLKNQCFFFFHKMIFSILSEKTLLFVCQNVPYFFLCFTLPS